MDIKVNIKKVFFNDDIICIKGSKNLLFFRNPGYRKKILYFFSLIKLLLTIVSSDCMYAPTCQEFMCKNLYFVKYNINIIGK